MTLASAILAENPIIIEDTIPVGSSQNSALQVPGSIRQSELANRHLQRDKLMDEPGREELGQALLDIGSRQDVAAFETIYNHFAGRVKSFLLGKGMDDAIAEELMQEILLIVWRRAESYDPTKAVASTWIFTIARNRRIDLAQESQKLSDAMLNLPPEQQQVMHLSYFRGQSHGDIAQWLGLPVGTVKSRIRLALQNVRTNMQAGDIDRDPFEY